MASFTESEIESLCIEELGKEGFSYCSGPSIAPDAVVDSFQGIEAGIIPYQSPDNRSGYEEVVLKGTLQKAIDKLNPELPVSARQEAFRAVLSVFSPQLIDANEIFHTMLTEGVQVTVQKDGQERGERVWLVDFQNPDANSYFVINQYTVEENNQNKRPDVILFINGLPLVVMELKNPADEQATVRKAYDQIQTYKAIIPSLFIYNAFCVISDGFEARAGTISSAYSRFQAWKTIDGETESSPLTGSLKS